MRRRQFIAGLGSAAAWPVVARAQQDDRVRRIGILAGFVEDDPAPNVWLSRFAQGLSDLGWKDGRNLRIDVRWAAGNVDRMRTFAKELRASTNYCWETTMQGSAVFNGVFELREGVTEDDFLPTLKAFYEHFIEIGFASGYHILRREALEGFGRTLPAFTYRGALIYPDMESEHAAYVYVKQNGEPVRSLHHAMNSKVKRTADFFVETCIVCHRSSSG